MRAVLQRVSRARVVVDGEVVGAISRGWLVLLGVGREDGPAEAERLARKIVTLRAFEDAAGKTNLSLLDVGGAVLVVSQFTLYADTRGGRRPSFINAAPPDQAEPLVRAFAEHLAAAGVPVASGVFGAHMEVELVNDGPFTLWLDTSGM